MAKKKSKKSKKSKKKLLNPILIIIILISFTAIGLGIYTLWKKPTLSIDTKKFTCIDMARTVETGCNLLAEDDVARGICASNFKNACQGTSNAELTHECMKQACAIKTGCNIFAKDDVAREICAKDYKNNIMTCNNSMSPWPCP